MNTEYRYRIKRLGGSSDKYGLCEVCGEFVSDVYQQVEERSYKWGWTLADCQDLFGHKECLVSRRKLNTIKVTVESLVI